MSFSGPIMSHCLIIIMNLLLVGHEKESKDVSWESKQPKKKKKLKMKF